MGVALERTCVICRSKKPKEELFRFIIKDGEVVYDKDSKATNRSFYVCSKECWEKGVKQKRKVKVSSQGNKMVGLPEGKFL